ncbi:MAG: PD-(D/E)XK nuclease-like domain-containing protein [Puniceicoccaceae bacterium]
MARQRTIRKSKAAGWDKPQATLPTGKLRNVSNEDYHATDAISASKLQDWIEDKLSYQARHVTRSLPQRRSDAMDFGTLGHVAVLEPHALHERYTFITAETPKKPTKAQLDAYERYPSLPNPTKAQTEAYQRTSEALELWQDIEQSGKLTVGLETWAHMGKCLDAIQANPMAVWLLEQATQRELTWREYMEPLGVYLQCRTDAYCGHSRKTRVYDRQYGRRISRGDSFIVDLKFVESLNPNDYTSWQSLFDAKYYLQPGFYSPIVEEVTGKPPAEFFFIVVQKKEPVQCVVFYPTDRHLMTAEKAIKLHLPALAESYRRNAWPAYDTEGAESIEWTRKAEWQESRLDFDIMAPQIGVG